VLSSRNHLPKGGQTDTVSGGKVQLGQLTFMETDHQSLPLRRSLASANQFLKNTCRHDFRTVCRKLDVEPQAHTKGLRSLQKGKGTGIWVVSVELEHRF
jgi:hypothetical protein